MRYGIYIKSHTDMPDYENEVEAKSKEKAVNYFYRQFEPYGWGKKQLSEYVTKL